ncbi:MAG: hypothetical protein WC440_00580 [Candidatus Omnitrophota bacterium]
MASKKTSPQMQQHARVESITSTPIIIARELAQDEEVAKLMPTTGEQPIHHEAILLGINSALANGLRRILMSEMPALTLVIDRATWVTNDPFIINDMIISRIMLLSLTQAMVKVGMKYTLDASNETDDPLDIYSRQFKLQRDVSSDSSRTPLPLPFFDNVVLLTLQPHCSIKFTANVEQGIGRDHAAYNNAFTSIAIPLDERPLSHPSTGFPSSEPHLPHNDRARYVHTSTASDPHDYMLAFDTVGRGSSGSFILARATDNFIARMEDIRKARYVQGQEKQRGGSSAHISLDDLDTSMLYTIIVPDETDTIGQMFAKSALAVFPNLSFVSGCASYAAGAPLHIIVRPGNTPMDDIISRTVNHAVEMLRTIRTNLGP